MWRARCCDGAGCGRGGVGGKKELKNEEREKLHCGRGFFFQNPAAGFATTTTAAGSLTLALRGFWRGAPRPGKGEGAPPPLARGLGPAGGLGPTGGATGGAVRLSRPLPPGADATRERGSTPVGSGLAVPLGM